MSDSNRIRISYIKEITRGTTPAGNLQTLNVASESLQANASSTQSAIVSDSGNMKDMIRTDFQPAGGINTELGFGFNDEFIEGAFRSAFETPISLSGTTFSIDASGSPITLDDSADGLGDLKPNDMIWVTGFTDENNNGAFVVGANTAVGSVDIIAVDPSKTPDTEAAGDSVTIKTTRLVNANTSSTFSIERFYSDVSKYMAWLGMEVDTMQLSFGASSVPTINFTFLGETHPPITATIGSGYDSASTNPVMDTVNGYLGTLISVDGAALESAIGCVTNVTYNISNSVRREQGLNCTTIGKGDFNLTVNFDIVFTDVVYYKAFQDNDTISIASGVVDNNNKGYGITIPTLRLTSASAPLAGANQTVTGSYQAQAIGSTVGSDEYTAVFSILE